MLRCQIEEDAGALNNEKSRREERLISELFYFLNFFLGSALQRVELFFLSFSFVQIFYVLSFSCMSLFSWLILFYSVGYVREL